MKLFNQIIRILVIIALEVKYMAELLPILFPIILLEGILVIVGIIAWLKTEHFNGSKWLWLLVIIFIGIIGPILFFIFGRRQD